MTELTVLQPSDLAMTPSFHAIATTGAEMAQAKAGIETWLVGKVESLGAERKEIQDALDAAQKHKWKTSTFKTMLSRLGQKELYYGKLLSACEAGFVIVPNMDVTVFAIRSNRSWPKWNGNEGTGSTRWGASPTVPDEVESRLPVGEGNYKSPTQKFHEFESKITKDGKELVHVRQVCDGFDQIEFPLAVAHPQVMDAVGKAMAMKIFDRIGIVPRSNARLRGDPIVLGQITRKDGYTTKTASFLIAWYVDARTL